MNIEGWGKSEIPFVPGLELSRRFYFDAVQPILERQFPDLDYSAGLLGYGSDVLGYDTPMSRDHMWGPRMLLFLDEEALNENAASVDAALRAHLPSEFMGYPTNFGSPGEDGSQVMHPAMTGEVQHLIAILSIPQFFQQEIGFDSTSEPTVLDWLTFPQQRLLQVTAGEVFHDDLGLEKLREVFNFYPDSVWLYLLACQWARISQEEHFVGRTGSLGDDTGSRLITSRLVVDLMRLAFLMERRYAPYSKWFGTAFRALGMASFLEDVLSNALQAPIWETREAALAEAYEYLAERHNDLGITEPIETATKSFYDRPFRVLFARRFSLAIQQRISDPVLKDLPLFGSVDQISSNTDFLENPEACRRMKDIYAVCGRAI